MVFKARFGTIGGAEVALIDIDLLLDAKPGALSVNVTLYNPEGKVTGNGVLLLSLVIEGGPPLVAEKDQLTVVDEVILPPVCTKENNTVDPAQIFNELFDVSYIGSVTKFALNCPETLWIFQKSEENANHIVGLHNSILKFLEIKPYIKVNLFL
jgi:hypothetical protein